MGFEREAARRHSESVTSNPGSEGQIEVIQKQVGWGQDSKESRDAKGG